MFNVAVVGTAPPADDVVRYQLVLARLTIASYAVLGIVSLVLTARRRHRRWFAYAFVTADALFVVANVELLLRHLQVPGAYVVALPSVWLAPLVLAFNALRYSWRVQAYAGAVLVGGLAVLTFRPGADGGPGLPHALHTMFSDAPNTMRVAMMALACAVLVVAVVRTRALLARGLEEGRRRARLTRYLPPQVARLVEERSAEDLRRGRRAEVAVLFVDIRGFTARAEAMTPEAVSRFLGEYRRALHEAADAAGGIVDKFVGDGAMVVFGVPRRDRVPARDALSCAHDILARIERWSAALAARGEPPVRVGIGLHLGEAFVGAVGDDVRLEFTVVGDIVNVAARMEEATKAAGAPIVASQAVLAAAGETGPDWQPLPQTDVRGHRAAVAACAFRPPG